MGTGATTGSGARATLVPRRHRGRVGSLLGALVLAAAACGATGGTGAPTTRAGSSRTSPTAPTASTTTPAPAPHRTTYGGNFSRTADDPSFPAVSSTPTARWTSTALDGGVYGEPLLDDGQVLVATENDTVYDLSAATGAVRWSDHVATPAPAAALPCGDISPTVGITSAMVIDPAHDSVDVSAETYAHGRVGHEVLAISLTSHAVLWSRDVDQPQWTAAAQLQRIALGLSDGHVLVAFGGNAGDCGAYNGWVMGVPTSGTGALETYRVPTAREGAIWAPAGVTVDVAGDVFVATGNGSAGAGQPFDHGDAVIELSPALAELGYFAPSNWAQDNADDGDLGSTSPILLSGGQVFEVGKEKTAYLLDADALGGIGGQLASLDVCPSLGGNAYQSPDVYVVCPAAGQIVQVRVGPGNSLAKGWTWSSPTGGAGAPTIAGGVVWTVDGAAARLYGVDQATGTTRFSLPLDTGTPEHFAAAAVAGGLVVVAGSSAVEAFG